MTTGEDLHDEFGLQWDGDPKMGGGFHVHTVGRTWRTERAARAAAEMAFLGRRSGFRIVRRKVSEWEVVEAR